MNTMALVVREDAYDRILTPLAFAYLGTASGYDEVNILFVNWAVRALTLEGLNIITKDVKLSPNHKGSEQEVLDGLKRAGLPTDIYEIIKAIKASGKVHYYGCSLAAQIFGVESKDLIPEADGITGATWFLLEKAQKADIFMTY